MGEQHHNAENGAHVVREEPQREHRATGDNARYADSKGELLKRKAFRRKAEIGAPRRLLHKTANDSLEVAPRGVS